MAAYTTLFGAVLPLIHHLFAQPIWVGFRELFPWAPAGAVQFWMGALMLSAGIARFVGLVDNGAASMSPRALAKSRPGVGWPYLLRRHVRFRVIQCR